MQTDQVEDKSLSLWVVCSVPSEDQTSYSSYICFLIITRRKPFFDEQEKEKEKEKVKAKAKYM